VLEIFSVSGEVISGSVGVGTEEISGISVVTVDVNILNVVETGGPVPPMHSGTLKG